jgi:hypothetical protein
VSLATLLNDGSFAVHAPRERFVVRYYDAKASKRGAGVRCSSPFVTRAEAEAFAIGRTLYAGPARIEVHTF